MKRPNIKVAKCQIQGQEYLVFRFERVIEMENGKAVKRAKEDKSFELLQKLKRDVRSVINTRRKLNPPPARNDLDEKTDRSNEGEELQAICHKVWAKFSNKHQKSPSHINNNVQSCMKSTVEKQQTEQSNDNHNGIRFRTQCEDVNRDNSLEKEPSQKNNRTVVLLFLETVLGVFRLSQVLFKTVGIIFIALLVFYSLITLHKPTQAFISRHTQDLIYPFMRALRILSLPVVRRIPVLTGKVQLWYLVFEFFVFII